jgi:hypothetical protein
VCRGGIYYATGREIARRRREEHAIWYHDFESGQATLLRRETGLFSRWRLEVSPDERWILFGQAEAWESELVVADGFR